MQDPVINIVNLARRRERREAVTAQMELVRATYTFWQGKEGPNTKHNIHAAFKPIVQMYKAQNIPACIIAEDDLVWTHPDSWKYYLENMPTNADVYTASYYSGTHDDKFVVTGFRGNTLVTIFASFFDRFLWLLEDHHLDAAMSLAGAKIVVCPKFCAIQTPGYSDQRKREADDSHRLKGKELFLGYEKAV